MFEPGQCTSVSPSRDQTPDEPPPPIKDLNILIVGNTGIPQEITSPGMHDKIISRFPFVHEIILLDLTSRTLRANSRESEYGNEFHFNLNYVKSFGRRYY